MGLWTTHFLWKVRVLFCAVQSSWQSYGSWKECPACWTSLLPLVEIPWTLCFSISSFNKDIFFHKGDKMIVLYFLNLWTRYMTRGQGNACFFFFLSLFPLPFFFLLKKKEWTNFIWSNPDVFKIEPVCQRSSLEILWWVKIPGFFPMLACAVP